MKLGHPNHPRRDVISEIEWAGENGFDFIDLFIEPDKAAVENIDPGAIREALAEHNLDVLGHMAWYLPIGSPMRQLRRAAVDIAVEHMRVFADVGAPAVTIHANWPPGLFSAEDGIAWQIESMRAIVEATGDLDTGLMYEPVTTEWDSPSNVKTILDAVPGLICHIDTGHSNLCGRRPEEVLKYFGDRVKHIHISDNNGLSDLHLPPGAGSIDWPAVFAALRDIGYDRTLTIEVFSDDRNYVLLAKRTIEYLATHPA